MHLQGLSLQNLPKVICLQAEIALDSKVSYHSDIRSIRQRRIKVVLFKMLIQTSKNDLEYQENVMWVMIKKF